jgi:hypothetical protein
MTSISSFGRGPVTAAAAAAAASAAVNVRSPVRVDCPVVCAQIVCYGGRPGGYSADRGTVSAAVGRRPASVGLRRSSSRTGSCRVRARRSGGSFRVAR